MELICGACHGRLLAEVPGIMVACPHCGTHLETPAAAPPPVEQPLELDVEDDPAHIADAEGDTVNIQLTNPIPSSATVAMAPEAFPVETAAAPAVIADSTAIVVPPIVESSPGSIEETLPEIPSGLFSHEASIAKWRSEPDLPDPVAPAETFPATGEAALSATTAQAAPLERPETAAPSGTPARGVSRLAFVVVLSYASAMTLACAFLLYQRNSNPGTLDLPDLVPPAQLKGKKIKRFLPEDKPVPAPNVLKLGESRQYGSVKVTPLRVTRGPVEFSFYKEGEDQTKDSEGPVLKLHLRFENVSPDQEFMPLDSVMVFSKDRDRKTFESYNTENFVSQVSNRGTRAQHAYVLDVEPNGAWLVKDQNLDEELAPGESLETFIPTTTENIEKLEGDLVWRFQFRKGYNRISHRGVTTLIEVLFKSSEIVDEETRPAKTPSLAPAEPSAKDA
jgi:hypothetical protein